MAKRKRLSPARMTTAAPEVKSATPRTPLTARPPIADVAHDAAASAALSEVAAELTAARAEDRLIQRLPLAAIDPNHLVRDRAVIDPEELDVLANSIATRGQQTAIEVTDLGEGRYGLISGFRRLLAVQLNATKAGEAGDILAIVRKPQDAADAYLSMVEENEIRANLTYYERGRIVARAADEGVFRADRLALAALFAAVPRARRSKIGAFVGVVRSLDDVLQFPTDLSEKQGLILAKRLIEEPGLKAYLHKCLSDNPPKTASAEAAILARAVPGAAPAPTPDATPGPAAPAPAKPASAASVVELRPGFEMQRHSDGSLTFQGEKMADRIFVSRLMDAVKAVL